MEGYKSLFPHVTSCHSARRRRAANKHVLARPWGPYDGRGPACTHPLCLPACCLHPSFRFDASIRRLHS
jgi:hypothetical protein